MNIQNDFGRGKRWRKMNKKGTNGIDWIICREVSEVSITITVFKIFIEARLRSHLKKDERVRLDVEDLEEEYKCKS
ncbi:hypothetical protein RF55_9608 [Lasius niger]|uniref:Uncharacterized protein n=1 Tax=Lasius niger TaxID=67767 RepID=A0A0J7KK62_LASNI|nr:hypothetical protein RF55_9608 [Lasius niger]